MGQNVTIPEKSRGDRKRACEKGMIAYRVTQFYIDKSPIIQRILQNQVTNTARNYKVDMSNMWLHRGPMCAIFVTSRRSWPLATGFAGQINIEPLLKSIKFSRGVINHWVEASGVFVFMKRSNNDPAKKVTVQKICEWMGKPGAIRKGGHAGNNQGEKRKRRVARVD